MYATSLHINNYLPTTSRKCACGETFATDDRHRKCFKCRNPARRDRALAKAPTAREREIIALVAEGLANKEIAARLFLAEGTVKDYLQRIFHKLGVGNRTQLAIHYVSENQRTTAQPGPAGPDNAGA